MTSQTASKAVLLLCLSQQHHLWTPAQREGAHLGDLTHFASERVRFAPKAPDNRLGMECRDGPTTEAAVSLNHLNIR